MNSLKKGQGVVLMMALLAVPIVGSAQGQTRQLASEAAVPALADGSSLLKRAKTGDAAPNERPLLASEQDLPGSQGLAQAPESDRRGARVSTERVPLASEKDLPRRN